MKFEIHFTVQGEFDEYEDSVIIEGDTLEECRKAADTEVKKRGGYNPWSREIEYAH